MMLRYSLSCHVPVCSAVLRYAPYTGSHHIRGLCHLTSCVLTCFVMSSILICHVNVLRWTVLSRAIILQSSCVLLLCNRCSSYSESFKKCSTIHLIVVGSRQGLSRTVPGILLVAILLCSQTPIFVLREVQASTICCASFWKAAHPTQSVSPSYFLLFSSGNCLGLPSQIHAHPGVASRGYLR